jgi:hypothetical protein
MIDRRWILLTLAVCVVPRSARSEPHLSGRTGLRCSRCHVSPTGGGKRSSYGALYAHAALTMSGARPTWHSDSHASSDERWSEIVPVTGEATSWLALGMDLRVANTTTFSEENENSFDATQGTLYLELRPWPDRIVLYIDEQLAAAGARNREAWALIHGPWSTYLRGGWLLPPFGLRVLDDDAYTRRVTGANFANSDMGLELGLDLGPLQAAVALTNGSFSGGDPDELKALWALVELNLSGGRFGFSGATNPTEEGCRSMGGAHGGLLWGRIFLQGEVDLIAERLADRPRWSYQLAALGQVDLLLTKGVGLQAGYDFHDGDLELRRDRRQRFCVGLDLFPLRMTEIKLHYVIKQSETPLPADRADRLEVTLHVYL